MVAAGLGTAFIPQMAIDHGLIDNQNLVVVDLWTASTSPYWARMRPSSSRVNTFNQLAQVVSELL